MDDKRPDDDLDAGLQDHLARQDQGNPQAFHQDLSKLPPRPCRHCGHDCRGVLGEDCPKCGRPYASGTEPPPAEKHERGMYCLRCRADLHGQPVDQDGRSKCPGCGLVFQPSNPATFTRYLERDTGKVLWRFSGAPWAATVAVAMLAGLALFNPWTMGKIGPASGSAIALAVVMPLWVFFCGYGVLGVIADYRPSLAPGLPSRVVFGLVTGSLLVAWWWLPSMHVHAPELTGCACAYPFMICGPLLGAVSGYVYDVFSGN